jgi:hypothetical protein
MPSVFPTVLYALAESVQRTIFLLMSGRSALAILDALAGPRRTAIRQLVDPRAEAVNTGICSADNPRFLVAYSAKLPEPPEARST